LLKAGGDNRQTVFLFSDSQIKDESFMEDVSMILNTGDVPNLYASDERAEIIEKMQNIARNEVPRGFFYGGSITYVAPTESVPMLCKIEGLRREGRKMCYF